MKSITSRYEKEDAQPVSNINPNHLRQTRLIHLSRKYFLRVSQRIREFDPTTVSVSQGKGGKKRAPSDRPCARPVILEGVKRNEIKSCRGGGVYICYDEKEHPTGMVSIRQIWTTGNQLAQGLPYSRWTSTLA